MENSPIYAETEDDDDELTYKDKKKSKKLGLYVINNEWFGKPDKSKEKEDSNPKESEKPKLELVKPPAEVAKPAAVAEVIPVPESEAPLETISEIEKEVILPNLAEAAKADLAEEPPDPITDPPVERFLEKVEDGEEIETAFDEVIAEMDIEQSEIPELETEEAEPIKDTVEEDEPLSPADFQREAQPIELSLEEEPQEDENLLAMQSAAASQTSISPEPTPTPKVETQPKPVEVTKPKIASTAMVGGLVGSLVGRRSERIKDEKDKQPIQEKLEKQVESLQNKLQETQEKIRIIASAKARKDGPESIAAIKDKPKSEKAKQREAERQRAPEANDLHISQPKPERIGHMLVNSESEPGPVASPEADLRHELDKKIEAESNKIEDRSLETLNRTELLAMSEKIIIDGSSLRQIFETHLIGESGLRRIIAEHRRGGDLKKALQREIVEREVNFETDPVTRNMKPTDAGLSASASATGSSTALSKMVEKASASINGNEEAAFIRAKAAYEAEQIDKQQKQRRVIDISFGVIIAILVALVLYLITSRG